MRVRADGDEQRVVPHSRPDWVRAVVYSPTQVQRVAEIRARRDRAAIIATSCCAGTGPPNAASTASARKLKRVIGTRA